MSGLTHLLRQRRELLLLALMLEMLHFSIWVDFGNPLSRSFLLIHLGLFLIWQPVWRGDAKLSWQNGVLFLLLTLIFVWSMSPWLIAAWLLLLTGVCGGRVILNRQQRDIYIVVLLFLVSELLINCTSIAFATHVPTGISQAFNILLPVLPVLIVFLPVENLDRGIKTVDILYAFLTMLLVSVLVMGALLYMYVSGTDYITALAQTLITMGLLIFLISWLLTPRAGFSGFSQLWTQSLLNIGTPFEQWLDAIDSHFERESRPDEFVEAAVWELVSLPWISGAKWTTQHNQGQYGELTKHSTVIETEQLTIIIYGYRQITGALYLHCKLLVQIINNFYVAKLRERTLTQQTHIQAIHETGARITHDIKNLLQSLQAITTIINSDSDSSQSSLSQQLLRKQLPNLTQRLQLALDKLRAPHEENQDEVYLKDWWHDLRKRSTLSNVNFQADISGDPVVPADLFDSVTDNLLQNLREKTQVEPGIDITVTLMAGPGHLQLMLCDSGSRIPEDKVKRIFNEPIESDTGLGIGLYQSAVQAEAHGYRLSLVNNQDGRVCFELTDAENRLGIRRAD